MAIKAPILTVSQLNRQIRTWLEHEIGEISVEGEVSNLSKPSSGHYYFSLKDSTAQLRCVYFRNRHNVLHDSALQNGQRVVASGCLSVYEARGDYQLIVEQLSEVGQGDLFQQFEQLKIKLAAQGLFEQSRKKQLPRFPEVIGVITSATGAALRDILTTLARRFPIANVIVYASDVQGKQAAPQLISAFEQANKEGRCQVLILARGGGSIEDLWAFNDESLAYTIASSAIPVISGVGHETDFTIADFIADLRAATPTAAAEAATPNFLELLTFFQGIQQRLRNATAAFIRHKHFLLDHALQKISSPKQLISSYWQTLDYLHTHLHRVSQQLLLQKRHQLQVLSTQLRAKNPDLLLAQAKENLNYLELHLLQRVESIINQHKQHLITQLATLHAVSPLATLERGYAIVTHGQTVVLDSQLIEPGDQLNIRLAKGNLVTKVLRNQ